MIKHLVIESVKKGKLDINYRGQIQIYILLYLNTRIVNRKSCNRENFFKAILIL